jgi:hypothetical protein
MSTVICPGPRILVEREQFNYAVREDLKRHAADVRRIFGICLLHLIMAVLVQVCQQGLRRWQGLWMSGGFNPLRLNLHCSRAQACAPTPYCTYPLLPLQLM